MGSFTEEQEHSKEWKRLKASESLLRLLIDSIPMFISYVDSEQRYVLTNALYADFFGKKRNQIIGRHVSEVLEDESYQKAREHIEAALRGQKQTYEYELRHGDKKRTVRAIYTPHLENGKVKGIFVLAMDITDRS